MIVLSRHCLLLVAYGIGYILMDYATFLFCRWENLIYKFGSHEETIERIIFHGDIVPAK